MGPGLLSLRVGAALSLAVAAALLTTGSGSPATAALEPEVGRDLLEPGRLSICSPFPRLRFAEMDSEGAPFGVDIDIGIEIATRLGLEADVRDAPFETLIDAVVERQCDVSIAGQFITQDRLAVIEMIPYRGGTPHVVVQAGDPLGIGELVDLCGRSMAVVSGTVHVEMVLGVGDYVGRGIDDLCRTADKPTVELHEYQSQAEAEDALAGGEVDAYSGNDFVAVERPADFALSAELPPIRNGIGLRKDADSLGDGIRAALDAMIEDGVYLAILEQYDVAHVALP